MRRAVTAPFNNIKTFDTRTSSFFFNRSVVQRATVASLPQLLDLTLNAVENLDKIKHIVNRTRPEELPTLLRKSGLATIAHLKHLNIQRIGTPLQLAFFSGDEDIVAYLKTVMDPAEFERQSKEAFGNALPFSIQAELDVRSASALEYHDAMLKEQKSFAKKLCDEAFQFRVVDGKNRFTVVDETISNFRRKFKHYVKNNPMHNPYILHRLYEIYEKSPGVYEEDCSFSHRAIGWANALSSARWLQYYAQGIYPLGDGNKMFGIEIARRSFICRNSDPVVDVRSFIPKRLGVDSFVSVFGRVHPLIPWGWCPAFRVDTGEAPSAARQLDNFCIEKTATCRKLLHNRCDNASANSLRVQHQ